MSREKSEMIVGNVKTFDMVQIKKQIKDSPTELQLYIQAKDRSINSWVDICNQAKAKIKSQLADYTKLQEERNKAVELLREHNSEHYREEESCTCLFCRTVDFLNQLEEKG